LIERLAAAGTPQVALSDFDCGYKVTALGLAARFRAFHSCRDLGFWKPSPVPLAKLQHDFGVAPRRHLHIGDRAATDGAACAANGCQFLHIDRIPNCIPRSAVWKSAKHDAPLLQPDRAGRSI
jgi:FMN phosphatase YigB (HAD superfamily)